MLLVARSCVYLVEQPTFCGDPARIFLAFLMSGSNESSVLNNSGDLQLNATASTDGSDSIVYVSDLDVIGETPDISPRIDEQGNCGDLPIMAAKKIRIQEFSESNPSLYGSFEQNRFSVQTVSPPNWKNLVTYSRHCLWNKQNRYNR